MLGAEERRLRRMRQYAADDAFVLREPQRRFAGQRLPGSDADAYEKLGE